MNFDIIDRAEAPGGPPPPRGRRAEEIKLVLNALESGKVARIETVGTEKAGGLKNQLHRVAGRLGKAVAIWEDDRYVYVELVEGQDRTAPTGNGEV